MKQTTKKPFRMLQANEHNELFVVLLKDSLLLAVYVLAAIRARRAIEESPDGLRQGEFWLSRKEFEKFGLKESQEGQIRRKIMKLIRLKVISKSDKRIDNGGANVYRMLSNKLIDMNYEIDKEKTIEQTTDRQRIDTNNNDKNDKNAAAVTEILSFKGGRASLEEDTLFVNGKKVNNPIAYLEAIKNSQHSPPPQQPLKPAREMTDTEILEHLHGKVPGRDEGINEDVLYEALERGIYPT